MLQQLYMENKLQNTALVLGNEDLLIPILNSIPSCIEDINITMGLPLKADTFFCFYRPMVPTSQRVVSIVLLSRRDRCVVTSICAPLVSNSKSKMLLNLSFLHIKHQNLISLSKEQIIAIAPDHKNNLELLFDAWNNQPSERHRGCSVTYF